MVENVVKRQGWRLPHWTAERAIYHVVFRLADSLPAEVLKGFRSERELLLRQPALAHEDEKRLDYLVSDRVEQYLDAGHGKCWLNQPKVAEIVERSVTHGEGKTYAVHAWCVMPNHVHVVFEPALGHQLPKILHSWKSFSRMRSMHSLARMARFGKKNIMITSSEAPFPTRESWSM